MTVLGRPPFTFEHFEYGEFAGRKAIALYRLQVRAFGQPQASVDTLRGPGPRCSLSTSRDGIRCLHVGSDLHRIPRTVKRGADLRN